MTEDDVPFTEALALLGAIARERLAPAEATARLDAWRRRHARFAPELLWEEDALAGCTYDLVLQHPEHGSVALTVASANPVPLPLRGLARWRDSDIARVDGRRIRFDDIMVLLDEVWADRRLLERIVNFAVMRRELEERPLELADAELQAAVDSFRAARGLATPDDTTRWLAARSMSLADLEDMVATELYEKHVRRRVVGEQARAAAAASPDAYDDVAAAVFAVPDTAQAIAVAEEIERGADFFRVAEGRLGQERGDPRARTIRFDRFTRADIVPLAGAVREGTVVAAMLRGAGPYVCKIGSVVAAEPDAAVEAAEAKLFAEWLRARRDAAIVEWHWSAA